MVKEAERNTKSATVSSLAPNSLTVPVFLAMVPSIISVTPQRRYVTWNPAPNTGRKSNKTLSKMDAEGQFIGYLNKHLAMLDRTNDANPNGSRDGNIRSFYDVSANTDQ